MCNCLHSCSEPINEKGVGYKLFDGSYLLGNVLTPLFGLRAPYCSRQDGSVHWLKNKSGNGFCFFLTKKEAERLLRELQKGNNPIYKDTIVVKIKYSGGLGKHMENNIISGESFETALCESFKIHKDEPYAL